MRVLFLSGDLIFAGRVRAAADAAGVQFQLSGRLPEQPDPSIGWIIVDLSSRRSLVPTIAGEVAERFPAAQLLAYAPHVQVELLRAARQAGIETVLTRGQFDQRLPHLFQDLS